MSQADPHKTDRDRRARPVWLIETGIWKDDNVARLIAILRDQGLTVHAEPHALLGNAAFEIVGDDQPVIFYGSLNTVLC